MVFFFLLCSYILLLSNFTPFSSCSIGFKYILLECKPNRSLNMRFWHVFRWDIQMNEYWQKIKTELLLTKKKGSSSYMYIFKEYVDIWSWRKLHSNVFFLGFYEFLCFYYLHKLYINSCYILDDKAVFLRHMWVIVFPHKMWIIPEYSFIWAKMIDTKQA